MPLNQKALSSSIQEMNFKNPFKSYFSGDQNIIELPVKHV
jgi:hypothetical protein